MFSRTASPTGRNGGLPARLAGALLLAGASPEKQMKNLSYSEQLRHPNWQKRRLEIMQRDEFTCQICYDSDSTLHVHHKHYIKGRMAWEYNDDELVTLCESCHEAWHDQGDVSKALLSRVRVDGPYSISEAIALVAGWAARGMNREDMAEFRDQSRYCYEIGRLASAMSDIGRYRAEAIDSLVDLIDCATADQLDNAIAAFAKALQEG